jgi:hypothetical protein
MSINLYAKKALGIGKCSAQLATGGCFSRGGGSEPSKQAVTNAGESSPGRHCLAAAHTLLFMVKK